jgi:hypothetical protein
LQRYGGIKLSSISDAGTPIDVMIDGKFSGANINSIDTWLNG